MDRRLMLLSGLAMGAGLMYLLDPDRGRRRRVLIGDQLRRAGNRVQNAVRATSRDALNRGQGLLAETRSMFQSWSNVSGRSLDFLRATRARSVSWRMKAGLRSADRSWPMK
jgi:hypothetical protein